MWLTTPDQRKLLHREPDIVFGGDTAAPHVTIDVDAHTTYQTMVGFGAAFTDASVHLLNHALPAARRDSLLAELFAPNGLGFAFMRLPIGASDFSLRHYTYDDVPSGERDPSLAHFSIDADRERIAIVKQVRALQPRLTLVASPWSAPAWMKSSESLVTGTLRADAYDAFAEYLVRFVQAYAREGIPIAALTIQNEPHFEPKDYPGMRLEPPARAAIVGRHLGPALERATLRTEIWDWDHNWDQPESPLAVLGDPLAKRYVRAIAWHCYGGDVSAQSTVHDAHPDRDAYFTECSGGDWAPEFGGNLKFNVGRLVIGATRNWARGVALWNLALDPHGGPHAGGCGNCRGVVTIDSATGTVTRNVEYWSLAHASRFVRPGAVRIASSAETDSVSSVAFRNVDGTIALVTLNSAASPRRIVVRATPNGVFVATLPAGTASTFVWR